MKLTPSLVLGTLTLGLGLGACKSLQNDLGRNVYERELEDSFSEEPAGVVGTTPDTRLVIFRENSFVAEPRPEGELLSAKGTEKTAVNVAPESSQGLRFFREASFRLAEARANSIEGMLALKQAGMDDRTIASMFPGREDWSAMYMNTLDMSREAIMAEFEAGSHVEELNFERELEEIHAEFEAESMRQNAELEKYEAELETKVDLRELELEGDDWDDEEWDGDAWDMGTKWDESCKEADCDGWKKCEGIDWAEGEDGEWIECEDEDLGPCDATGDRALPTCEEEAEDCSFSEAAPCVSDEDCALPTCEEELSCEGLSSSSCTADAEVEPEFSTCTVATTASGLTTLSVVAPELPALSPILVEAPRPEPEGSLEGTKTTPRAGKAWKIKYSSPERAGETIELVVHNLDAAENPGTAPDLTATFTLTLNKKGKGNLKASLPEGWRLVRLEAPGAKPLFAVFL